MRCSYNRRAVIFMLIIVFIAPGVIIRAQGYRVQVYNPQIYSRTRQTMSNRAALRAALKRKRERERRRRAEQARVRGRGAR